jgi:WD40 repeat protein
MGYVSAVDLSADGRFCVSGSSDRTLKLWEVESGRELRTFKPNLDWIKSAGLSADNDYILADNGYDILKLWKISTGRHIRSYKGVWLRCAISLSVDGCYALSASGDAKLWDIATGECLRKFAEREYLFSISMSADGRFALTGSGHEQVKLWDIATGNCLHTFGEHRDRVGCVHLGVDGRFALSGSDDKTIKLWALDWELEDKEPADWDEGARPYLETFLTLHTPYAGTLPHNREPSEDEITLALTRRGKPVWAEEDFQGLLYTLGCAGYGWLRPEGVRRKLEEMAAKGK